MQNLIDDPSTRSTLLHRLIAAPVHPLQKADATATPRVIAQFWDDLDAIPVDVQECMLSWSQLGTYGFKQYVYDDKSASEMIERHFTKRHVRAFSNCPHPAMRSDYFRYCYILKFGGWYIDADDAYLGGSIEPLLTNGRLKLNPLCFDISANSMRDAVSASEGPADSTLIFYTDTTPLIAPANHPVIASALEHATKNILTADNGNRDVQSITGPGNLTLSLAIHAQNLEKSNGEKDFEFIRDWGSISESRWPLGYREDDRNWRIWEQGK
ncbi:MAG: glycosyltransferase [Rhodococcus sp. (in: high G+C Gram-positive bacteria)]